MTLLRAMKAQNSQTVTAKGSAAFRTTGSALVDMLAGFGTAIVQEKKKNSVNFTAHDAAKALQMFKKAFAENPLYAIRLLFYFRDVRGGGKMKVAFTKCFAWLADNQPEIAKQLVKYIPEYGYYKDLVYLLDTEIGEQIALSWYNQIVNDVINLRDKNYSEISLAAKWFPSERSGKLSQIAYEKIVKHLGMTATVERKKLRKMLTEIRAHLRIVETFMSTGAWDKINYSHVPAAASKLYAKAFRNHDGERYAAFHDAVLKGEVKLNTTSLTAVDILYGMNHNEFARLPSENYKIADNFWNALTSPEKLPNILVMADTSGSMTVMYNKGNAKYTPYDISVALAMYFAERLPKDSPFYNHFITFSSRPQLVDLGERGKTLREKYATVQKYTFHESTEVDKAMALVLRTAINNNLGQEAMPEVIMVISDGQFDGSWRETNFERWSREFTNAGYILPTILSWNVGTYNTKPTTAFQPGAILLSGFCESLLSNVLDGEFANFTPEKAMLKIVEDNPRYNVITYTV